MAVLLSSHSMPCPSLSGPPCNSSMLSPPAPWLLPAEMGFLWLSVVGLDKPEMDYGVPAAVSHGDCILTSCTVVRFSRQLRSASSRTTDLWAPLSWALYLDGTAVFAFSKLAPGGPAAAIRLSRPCLCFLAHDSPASLLEVRTKRLSSPLKEVVLEFPDRWTPS